VQKKKNRMVARNSSRKEQAEQVLITGVFDAPRDLVFKAWTEPERPNPWTSLPETWRRPK